MILIDLIKVLIFGKKSETAIVDYLSGCGYDRELVKAKIASLHPYPYGTCFTSKEWYGSIRQEDEFYNRIFDKIAYAVDPNNRKLAKNLRQFAPYNLRQVYDDTIDGLQRLSQLDDIILCSNSHASTRRLLQRFGIDQYISGVVLSCDIGLAKPDTAFYQYVLDKYKLSASECVFVDDNADNIAAARSLGITAYCMDRSGKAGDVHSLSDVVGKLLQAKSQWQIKSINKSAKNTYGTIIVDDVERFYKQFDNLSDYAAELEHYRDVRGVLNIPSLIATDKSRHMLVYENIDNISTKTLHYALYNNQPVDYKFLNYGYDKLSKTRIRDSINAKFFYNRMGRIDEYISRLSLLDKRFVIDNQAYYPKRVLRQIKRKLADNRLQPSVISQGDPIDLNILEYGKVIDLETAGRNSLAADLAILINNILINGYSFFIKYAKSDYRNYMDDYYNNQQALVVKYNIDNNQILANTEIDIPENNRKYLIGLIGGLEGMYPKEALRQVDKFLPYYLAFRMITPKDLVEMSESDQILAISLMIKSLEIGTLPKLKKYLSKDNSSLLAK